MSGWASGIISFVDGSKRLIAAALLMICAGCSHDVAWRSYQTSEYLDVRREYFGRIHLRYDTVTLTDCTVCFGPRAWYTESCVRIDETGMFRKAANRSYAWLREIECRMDHGEKVKRDFKFPFYAADVRAPETTNYLGDIQVDMAPDGGTLVAVNDDLAGFMDAWDKLGQPPFVLKVKKSLLTLQDTLWVEEKK